MTHLPILISSRKRPNWMDETLNWSEGERTRTRKWPDARLWSWHEPALNQPEPDPIRLFAISIKNTKEEEKMYFYLNWWDLCIACIQLSGSDNWINWRKRNLYLAWKRRRRLRLGVHKVGTPRYPSHQKGIGGPTLTRGQVSFAYVCFFHWR